MVRLRVFKAAAIVSLVAVSVAACAGSDKAEVPQQYTEQPVDKLYNKAVEQLKSQKYGLASTAFEEVERQHPYSVWATRAQLMAAYSYYQENLYDKAVAGLSRFIDLHPTNRDVAYAYYLRGLSYYEQITDVSRDQEITQKALGSLNEVVTRFPESKYAKDAKVKLELTNDHLAGKQMEIGRYYHTRGQYLAAINRFRVVLDQHQTTTHVPEALHRLTEAYLALGIKDEARKTASVLGHNFPGSEWYSDSYVLLTGIQPGDAAKQVAATPVSDEKASAKAGPPPRDRKQAKKHARPHKKGVAPKTVNISADKSNAEPEWYDSLKFW